MTEDQNDAASAPIRRKTVGAIAAGSLLALAVACGWWFSFHHAPLPDGLIQANGRIEGDHYVVAGKVAGKVVEIRAHEGDTVAAGQILARLDGAQQHARVDQARAAVKALEAQIAASSTVLDTLRQQVPLQIAMADDGVARTRAALAAADANARQTARDAERYRHLAQNGAVERHRAEQAELARTTTDAQLTSARAALAEAEKRLTEARLGHGQIRAQEQDLAAQQARRVQAQASLSEAAATLDDLTIRAPAGGVITTRIIDTGEVVATGSPQFDIVDLDRLYLKVYIPGAQIGKVRLGLPARIYTDAFPDRPFAATVRYIASRAEFTPKEVQTPDERVKLVYAVKLYLAANPQHRLTPGLPADAVIRWREDTPWARPRW